MPDKFAYNKLKAGLGLDKSKEEVSSMVDNPMPNMSYGLTPQTPVQSEPEALDRYKRAFTSGNTLVSETYHKAMNQLGNGEMASGSLNALLTALLIPASPIISGFGIGSEVAQDVFGKDARGNLDAVLDPVGSGAKILDKGFENLGVDAEKLSEDIIPDKNLREAVTTGAHLVGTGLAYGGVGKKFGAKPTAKELIETTLTENNKSLNKLRDKGELKNDPYQQPLSPQKASKGNDFVQKPTEFTEVKVNKATEGGKVNNSKVKEGKIDPVVIEKNTIESKNIEIKKTEIEVNEKKAPKEIEGNQSQKTARSESEGAITPQDGEGIRSGITYKEPKIENVAKEQVVQKGAEPISVTVQGQEFKAKGHLEAYEKANKALNPEMKLDDFMDKVVQKEVNDRINAKNSAKIEEIKIKNAPAEESITKVPRSEIPEPISKGILEEAQQMKAELKGGKVTKGKSFFNEDLNINGKYTINELPDWFRGIEGDKKAILNALDKIIKDKGLDKGVMVERVKSKILEHLVEGKEDAILLNNKGKQTREVLGKNEPHPEISEFFKDFIDKDVPMKDLAKKWEEFDSATKFEFGENKKSEPIGIERTGAGEQITFGKTTALQPKNVKFDKGEKGSPLFEQKKTDPNQLNLDQAFKNIEEKSLGRTNMFGDPTIIKDYVVVAKHYIEKGIKTFKDFASKMIEKFGAKIKPHLRKIWGETQRDIKKQTVEAKKITDAIKSSKIDRKKTDQLYAEARGQKYAKLMNALKNDRGESAFINALKSQKGELPKADFEAIRSKFNQKEIDNLYSEVQSSNLNGWEQLTAMNGLTKVLGERGGKVPTLGELDLLKRVFGEDFTRALQGKKPVWDRIKSNLTDIINIPRALVTSTDMSAALRQGLILTISKPKQSIPALKAMHKYFFSDKAFKELTRDLETRPNAQLYEQSGLYIARESVNLAKREEAFMSHLAEQIPVLGHIVRASERAYIGYLNKVRVDVFDSIVKELRKEGTTFQKDPKTYQDIANFVNLASGRGSLGKSGNRVAPVLNGAFFSIRNLAAKVQLTNPTTYVKMTKRARKEAMKSMISTVATVSSMVSLATLIPGVTVEKDPRSADFMKIRYKNTRIDPWGGFQQFVRFTAQMVTGETKSSISGKIRKLDANKFPFETRLDRGLSFIGSKASPQFSIAGDILRGQTMFGEDLELDAELYKRLSPLYIQDVIEASNELGIAPSVVMTMFGFYGAGLQTYGKRKKKTTNNSQWKFN